LRAVVEHHQSKMPDIDPAALTRTDSFSQPLGPPALTSKLNGITAISTQKATKAANVAQRVDCEPLYTSLKAAIGERWSGYKEAVSLFVLGRLLQSPLIDICF